jgi:hypothetical protein
MHVKLEVTELAGAGIRDRSGYLGAATLLKKRTALVLCL